MHHNIFFRCDSSKYIGTGHVMRCLNLADRLTKYDFNISFICRELENNIIQVIEDRGFHAVRLPAFTSSTLHQAEFQWAGKNLEQEISEVSAIVSRFSNPIVIVDHYALGMSWEMALGNLGCRLIAIDDLFRQHFVDAILDQNFHPDHLQKWLQTKSKSEKYFLGQIYSLLPVVYSNLKTKNSPHEHATKVLGFFGGADAAKVSEKFLGACNLLIKRNEEYECTLIIGAANERKNELSFLGQKLGVKILNSMPDISHLLLNTDLYVGAGGSTNWERCFLGVPSIILSVAENQSELSRNLEQLGTCQYLGDNTKVSVEEFSSAIDNLLRDFNSRKKQSEKALELGVSSGIEEVVSYIRGLISP